MRIHKTIKNERGNTITIYGSDKNIKIVQRKPLWGTKPEPAFKFKDRYYYLSEFINILETEPEWLKEYSGQITESIYSGILIKIENAEHVKAYTYVM